MRMSEFKEPEWVFPFEGMLIGDSFFIPTLDPSPMLYAIERGAKRSQIVIKCFVTQKDGCLGVRAWRVA